MKLLTATLFIGLGMLFGSWVAVRDFKAHCEKMSSPSGTVFWLECDQ